MSYFKNPALAEALEPLKVEMWREEHLPTPLTVLKGRKRVKRGSRRR
jgi:hypothetical protein